MDFSAWLELFFPGNSRCPLCRNSLGKNSLPLCKNCLKEVGAWVEEYLPCKTCGRFLPYASTCLQCTGKLPVYNEARALGPYRGILKKAVYELKFHGKKELAHPSGYMKAAKVMEQDWDRDFLLPVPLDRKRLEERGYNQAQLLTKEIGKQLRSPLLLGVLLKKRSTQAQAKLSREARMRNLRNSFLVASPEKLKGKKLILVDDILTTGSTAEECTKTLLAAGTKVINVITIASGIQKSSTKTLK